MKTTLIISLLLFLGMNLSAQESVFNTRLIPTPQKVIKTDGSLHIDENSLHLIYDNTPTKELKQLLKQHQTIAYCHQVNEIPGAQNQAQAYILSITPTRIDITYTQAEGLSNACKTLQYLAQIWNQNVPCMEIIDWPAYEYRGWLDDISRGPITNAQFSQLQQQTLQRVKMNFGSYYTEHSLYNPKYPDIVPTNSIGNYQQGMMANLQCFAHFEKTLRIPFYQYMKDSWSNVNPAEPRTYDFLADQIANTVKNYPNSQFININCDETEGLGSGRAKDYVNSIGADEAYCKHINKVYDLIQPYNKEILMWGDIVGKDPSMLKKLPKDMQYVVWSYVAQDNYNSMLEPFKKLHQEQGTQFWVAPGVSHWSSIPQVRNYIKNIAMMARDGYQSGARGLINTAWDDSGESLFGDCWHAMLWAAEMAWNPIKNTNPQLAEAEMAERERIFNQNYQMAYGTQLDVLYKVGDLATNPWVGDWFNTGTLMQPLLEFYPSNVDEKTITRCDSVDRIVKPILQATLNDPTLKHFTYSCNRILAVSAKSRLRAQLYKALNSQSPADIQSARDMADKYFQQIHSLKKEYLLLWDEEADAYSRDIICNRYDQLGNEVLEAFNHVFISTSNLGNVMVSMKTIGNDVPIYYTLDGRKPSTGSTPYSAPFKLERSCIVKMLTQNQWGDRFENEKYLLLHKGMGHLTALGTEYSTYKDTYSGGGDNALADGEMGSELSYSDGHWQGYWGNNIIADYNFGQNTPITTISMRFLQNTFDWILAPQEVELYTSKDGKNWTLTKTQTFNPDFRIGGNIVHDNAIRDLNIHTQYLRVVVKNPGKLPEWHPAKGWDSYLFIDEIVIE